MSNNLNHLPEGYHSVTPYLIVKNAAQAIEFYKKAFGVQELMRYTDSNGKVCHAEIKIGNSPIMLAEEFPEMNVRSPHSIGGSPISIHLYVEDVDAFAKQATTAGAKITRPIQDQFYGDRNGTLEDPFGHIWHIATRKENLSVEEIDKRMANLKK